MPSKDLFSAYGLATKVGMWSVDTSRHIDMLRYRSNGRMHDFVLESAWRPFQDASHLELCYRLAKEKCTSPRQLNIAENQFDHMFRTNLYNYMAKYKVFSADVGTVWITHKTVVGRAIYRTVAECEILDSTRAEVTDRIIEKIDAKISAKGGKS